MLDPSLKPKKGGSKGKMDFCSRYAKLPPNENLTKR